MNLHEEYSDTEGSYLILAEYIPNVPGSIVGFAILDVKTDTIVFRGTIDQKEMVAQTLISEYLTAQHNSAIEMLSCTL